MSISTCGVLLAAGSGSRYGMPKVLAHGGAWRQRAVSALLDGGCDHVVVVLGAADVPGLAGAWGSVCCAGTPRVSTVHNPDWPEGMGSSLRVGLVAAGQTTAALAVIHLVDTPDVGPDVVARVINAVRSPQHSRVSCADEGEQALPPSLREGLARACYGTVPGHPVAIGRHFWGDIIATSQGDVGARLFLRDHRDLVTVQCGDLATGRDHDVSHDDEPFGRVL